MLNIDIFGLIITLVVLGVIFYLITLLPMAEPFPTLIKVVAILAAILWLAQKFL